LQEEEDAEALQEGEYAEEAEEVGAEAAVGVDAEAAVGAEAETLTTKVKTSEKKRNTKRKSENGLPPLVYSHATPQRPHDDTTLRYTLRRNARNSQRYKE
jgi:hypothetical protein